MYLKQDGTPPHYNLVHPKFPNRAYLTPCVGTGRPTAWPSLSRVFLGTFKDWWYSSPLLSPESLREDNVAGCKKTVTNRPVIFGCIWVSVRRQCFLEPI